MTDGDLDELKAALRRKAHEQRQRIGGSARVEAAAAAAEHFFAHIAFAPGQIVGAYWPIRDEIDCKPVLARLMDAGQPVCLPVIGDEDEPMTFRLWEQGAPLYPAGFGTLAPADAAPVVEPDVMIIPLLGFDALGTRLGYGKGHYDRTLAAMEKAPMLIGYAFAAQQLDFIPRGDHDVPLDAMVTEAGVRFFGGDDAPAAGVAS